MASGDRLALFKALDLEPLVSNTARMEWRNQHPVLAFDPSTQQYAVFFEAMPDHYDGNGVTATVGWAAEDTSVGPHDVRWEGQFERLADDGQDMDSDGFATAQAVTDTEPSGSGELSYAQISFTNSQIDGIQAGDAYRFKLSRNTGHADDDGSSIGDAQVRFIRLEES